MKEVREHNQEETVELSTENVTYFSQNDEAALFEWLGKIKCVSGYSPITIDVRKDLVDECDLRDILALFHRYNIDKKQLIILERSEFSRWFRGNKDAYWYKEIFENDGP